MNAMTTDLPMGTVVAIDFGWFTHSALVSTYGADGKPMLISATRRTGTVLEEHWDAVVQGKPVTVVARPHTRSHAMHIVANGRQFIRRWRYHATQANCEHFTSAVVSGKPFSPQVRAWATVGIVATIAAVVLATRGR